LFHISQLTLTLGSLLGQDVTPERLAMLIATFTGFFKPLGRTTTGFHFGHFHSPHSKVSLMVSPLQTNNGTARGIINPCKKETAKTITSCLNKRQREMSSSRIS
jgi:hypothetical protein